jgi:nucleotide-binding universal stress UspA family protein
MNDKMRILIAYDGSDHARAALGGLRRAGLPREGEALIVSVADVLVSPSTSIKELAGAALTSRRVTSAIMQAQTQASRALEEARGFASAARRLFLAHFPAWEVRAETMTGTPSWELIQKADAWGADLIVVGSHGRSGLGRFFLGSVSKKVATESRCSVRVARRAVEKAGDEPVRIIIGVDGSPGAEEAVRQVGGRVWAKGTEVRLIAADARVSPTGIADILPTAATMIDDCNEESADKARTMLEWAEEGLRAIGLSVSVEISKGDPQRVLIDAARKWEADSIFVGSRGFDSALERFRAGSVSTGLVTGAPCSVEVVRGGRFRHDDSMTHDA